MIKILFVLSKYYETKLLLISHLLLGEKTVRVAEGDAPNSFGKMGGNQWDALRASHQLALKKPLSSVLVYLLYQARTYFQTRWLRTLRVRGGSDLSRTLGVRPVARLADSAATPHTLFSALLNFFGGGIQKRKSKKCVRGSALQVFGQDGACGRSDGSAGGVWGGMPSRPRFGERAGIQFWLFDILDVTLK